MSGCDGNGGSTKAGGDDFAESTSGGLVGHERFAVTAFGLKVHQIAAGDPEFSGNGGFTVTDAFDGLGLSAMVINDNV
ncbi:MAG TPA: hypothetical protein VJ063_14590 [Verrucomicrobiae bacterium]|nr:hypothetical protein [Verrucomicrobiae bacterium]